MKLQLTKPLCFFDLETTGTDISKDRIVEIAILKLHPDGSKETLESRVNPEMPIPAEASAVHGITNEMVAEVPTFKEQSQKICDLRELVFDQNTEEVVSYLSITINPDSLAQMQIAFPHAVNLKNSVQLQIDENDPLELNYAYCNQSACFIAEIIADNFINMFKAGNQITLKVLLLDNREATITYSLLGFTAGYNKLLETVNS